MIPQDTIEKIISLSKVEEVIGDFVALRRAGSNYKGCCPFHDEKTPSFVVSPAKGIYKCFGCGKAGNAVTFIKEHEKCSYFDAIRYLGKKYHVEIVETELTDEEKQRRDIKESLNIVNEFAAKYFQKTMWETEEGKNIGLAYFIERGFTEETIRKFQLGYSPQKKDAFTTAAEKAGYKLEYLQKVGLTSVGDKYKADRFHGRVMFPITSVSGMVIGFGGRVMTPANEHVQGGAKYVNSPESEVYNKSRTLYGISFAKNEIVRKNECILVEGYTDVLSMHQAGICNVVASSGTSLTEEQIILINRFTQNIVIIYDGDNAGIKAATRGIDMILAKEMNVSVLLLPDGDDPDSFAKKHSSQEISDYIDANKTDFLTFRTRLAAKEFANDPIKRAQFINSIAETIAKIPNQITRSVFIQECSKILNIDQTSFTNQVKTLLRLPTTQYKTHQTQQTQAIPQNQERKTKIDQIEATEKEILGLLILYGTTTISMKTSHILSDIYEILYKEPYPNQPFNGLVKDYIYEEITGNGLDFTNETTKKIFNEYFANYEKYGDKINDYLRDFIAPEFVANILSNTQTIDVKYWYKTNKDEENKKIEEEQAKQLELLPIAITETLLEYAKRRFEQLKYEKNKEMKENWSQTSPDDMKKNLEQINKFSKCINLISKKLHHTSR